MRVDEVIWNRDEKLNLNNATLLLKHPISVHLQVLCPSSRQPTMSIVITDFEARCIEAFNRCKPQAITFQALHLSFTKPRYVQSHLHFIRTG